MNNHTNSSPSSPSPASPSSPSSPFIPAILPETPTTNTYIFGYGSLCWRPGFSYLSARPCYIHGFVRRFYQASTDHRGTPQAPGRVVTLIPVDDTEQEKTTYGMVYLVHSTQVKQVIDYLTYREKGGYILCAVVCHLLNSDEHVNALTYIGTPSNPNYVGNEKLSDIARIIRSSAGPSGSNKDYLLKLHSWLQSINVHDSHVAELVALVNNTIKEKQEEEHKEDEEI